MQTRPLSVGLLTHFLQFNKTASSNSELVFPDLKERDTERKERDIFSQSFIASWIQVFFQEENSTRSLLLSKLSGNLECQTIPSVRNVPKLVDSVSFVVFAETTVLQLIEEIATLLSNVFKDKLKPHKSFRRRKFRTSHNHNL